MDRTILKILYVGNFGGTHIFMEAIQNMTPLLRLCYIVMSILKLMTVVFANDLFEIYAIEIHMMLCVVYNFMLRKRKTNLQDVATIFTSVSIALSGVYLGHMICMNSRIIG